MSCSLSTRVRGSGEGVATGGEGGEGGEGWDTCMVGHSTAHPITPHPLSSYRGIAYLLQSGAALAVHHSHHHQPHHDSHPQRPAPIPPHSHHHVHPVSTPSHSLEMTASPSIHGIPWPLPLPFPFPFPLSLEITRPRSIRWSIVCIILPLPSFRSSLPSHPSYPSPSLHIYPTYDYFDPSLLMIQAFRIVHHHRRI